MGIKNNQLRVACLILMISCLIIISFLYWVPSRIHLSFLPALFVLSSFVAKELLYFGQEKNGSCSFLCTLLVAVLYGLGIILCRNEYSLIENHGRVSFNGVICFILYLISTQFPIQFTYVGYAFNLSTWWRTIVTISVIMILSSPALLI